MAFRRKTLYTFDTLSDTGLHRLPKDALVMVVETNDLFSLGDLTGIDENTTIEEALNNNLLSETFAENTDWKQHTNIITLDPFENEPFMELYYSDEEKIFDFFIIIVSASNIIKGGSSIIIPANMSITGNSFINFAHEFDAIDIYGKPEKIIVYLVWDANSNSIKVYFGGNRECENCVASINYDINDSLTNSTYQELNWIENLDFLSPIQIKDLTASDNDGENCSITIDWSDARSNPRPIFDLYRDGGLLASNVNPPFKDTNVSDGQTYEYYIISKSILGKRYSNKDTGITSCS